MPVNRFGSYLEECSSLLWQGYWMKWSKTALPWVRIREMRQQGERISFCLGNAGGLTVPEI